MKNGVMKHNHFFVEILFSGHFKKLFSKNLLYNKGSLGGRSLFQFLSIH